MTLIVPLGVLLAIGVSQLISGITEPPVEEVTTIGYVDEAGGFDQYTTHGNIELVRFNTPDEATTALINGNVSEYFVISGDYISTGLINRYTLEKQLETPSATTTVIKNFLTYNLLKDKVPPETVNRIESPLNLVVTRLTETGAVAPEQGGLANLVIPIIFGALLAASLAFSSSYLLQGLGAEKENRLMEILLSSVSTRQLITGKVLGIGAAGLAQVAIWVAATPLLLNLASSSIGGFISTIQIPPNLLALAVVYFILGYLVFAVLSVGVAAVSSSVREAQGLASIIYPVGNRAILAPIANHSIPKQPSLGCSQYFSLLGAGAGDIAAWLDWRPRVATSHQHGRVGLMHYWGTVTGIETSEDLYTDVR